MSEATEPKRLGDFEIVGEIGRGGMGVVYEARQLSLNRKVALKVLSGGLGLTSKAVVRFRREAEAAAKLHHTNIVPIYATGEEAGTHYYAMELIEGPSLSAVIRQARRGEPPASAPAPADTAATTRTETPLPQSLMETLSGGPAEPASTAGVRDSSSTLTTGGGYFDTIAKMIADVADALDYAHDQGVIHRDIKPSNLLVSPSGKLSINDFGLARMLEQPGMTTSGEFMGTPMYMSPEQITAGRAPLDHRTDIYSLGATLYELLTLEPPFPGERRDQIIAQIIGKEPRPVRRVNKKVPVDLETVCLKAMEKDPDRRYQTAGAMAEDLRRFVNRFAISAKRAGPIVRTVKWMRRRPGLAVTIVVALLAAGAAGLFAYSAHTSKRRMTEVQRHKAMDDALLAAMSGDFDAAEADIQQAEVLGAHAGWIRMLRGQVALHEGWPLEAIQHLEQAVQLLPDSVAAWSLLAGACVDADDWQRAYELLQAIDRLTPVTAEDFLFKGLAEGRWGPTRGLEALDEAIRRRDSAVGRVMRARARRRRAVDTANPEDVEAALEDAAVAKSMLPDSPIALDCHLRARLAAANVFAEIGKEARRDTSLAEAERDAHALERFAGLSLAHQARAAYFEHVGQDDDALEERRRASECPNAPTRAARSYAVYLCRAGHYEEALRAFDQLEWESMGSTSHLVRAYAYILAALPSCPERALAAYCEAMASSGDGLISLWPQTALRLLGRKADAVEVSRQMRARFSRPPTWMFEWYEALMDYSCDVISAEELLRAAGPSRRNLCEAHFFIAINLLAEGDRRGATEQFQKSVDTHVDYFERSWSRAFLTRMKQDPTWPPWIPVKAPTTTRAATQPGADDHSEAGPATRGSPDK